MKGLGSVCLVLAISGMCASVTNVEIAIILLVVVPILIFGVVALINTLKGNQ